MRVEVEEGIKNFSFFLYLFLIDKLCRSILRSVLYETCWKVRLFFHLRVTMRVLIMF